MFLKILKCRHYILSIPGLILHVVYSTFKKLFRKFIDIKLHLANVAFHVASNFTLESSLLIEECAWYNL